MDYRHLVDVPADFLWGASTSAYQVEGGWDVDGKGPSVIDVRTHFPAGTTDYKVASDHYYRFEADVELFAELGLKAYRFSIAWTRILPTGTGEVNRAGVDFYHRLLDALLAKGIEPVVTMYHFDLPAALDAQGGWGNRATIDAFVEYARILFTEYGDKVRYWLTINEQNMMVLHGDAVGTTGSAGADGGKKGVYQQSHHMFLAAARASALLHELVPGAKIGPAPNIVSVYPASPAPEDVLAADDWDAVRNLMYLDVAVHGRYHPLAWRYLTERGWEPDVADCDAEVLAAAKPDVIAFNYYSTQTVGASRGDASDLASRDGDQQLVRGEIGLYRAVKNEFLPTNAFGWEIDPVGLRTTLRRLRDRYGLPLIITENGIGGFDTLEDGRVHDAYRIDYYRRHIEQLRLALTDGVELFGYCPWSAIDLVSTHSGASKRYGFIYVDRDEFDLKSLDRVKKDSFDWYRRVIASNGTDLG